MNEVLALYDCRSKQEYIYRTNHVKEITGASELLRNLFTGFFESEQCKFNISRDWENLKAPDDYFDYFRESGFDAEIIYEGGGNLCVIFKDEKTYKDINKALSRYVLEKTYTVNIIASYTKIEKHDGKYDFVEDRKKLYAANTLEKNTGSFYAPCNVLPFTQVDRLTYQPIVKKDKDKQKQYTKESFLKQKAYETFVSNEKLPIFEKEFDNMVEKHNESLLAIIYIDGNNMGEKLKNKTLGLTNYSEGINALRDFSKQTNHDFVQQPVEAIKDCLLKKYIEFEENGKGKFNSYSLRIIISGGDEITLVCNARAVPLILETYFETLKKSDGNTACAGVAIFHSHAPYADVYEIAEQCCESGKKKAHVETSENKNFIDFHYCHSGITNSLEAIRERQEAEHTARPYEYSTTWQEFIELGSKFASEKEIKVKRSDIKSLSEAIYKGDSYYNAELKRIYSRQKDDNLMNYFAEKNIDKKLIYDISIVYDLWFGKEGE